MPFLPITYRTGSSPRPRTSRITPSATFSTFALYAPARPRSDVSTSTPAFAGCLAILEQRVLHGARLARQVLHRLGELDRVRARRLHALLRLHDPRGRDQLHRARDLLRRLDRADPPADDAELRSHLARPRRREGPALTSSSSASEGLRLVLVVVVDRRHPIPADVGLDLVGGRPGAAARLAAGDRLARSGTSARTPRRTPSASPRSRRTGRPTP